MVIFLFFIQWAVIVPKWNKVILQYKNVLFIALIRSLLYSLIIGVVFGFMVWQKQFGIQDLLIPAFYMTFMQMLYLFGNFLTLYIIDKPYTLKEVK